MTRSLYLRLMGSAITLSIATMAFGMLDGVVSLTAGSRLGDTQKVFCQGHSQLVLGYSLAS
jgi:hypothetical protein